MKLHTNIVSLFLIMSCLHHPAYGSQHKTSEQEKQRNELALEKAYHDDNYPEFLRLLSRGARACSILNEMITSTMTYDSEMNCNLEKQVKYVHKIRKQLSAKEVNDYFHRAERFDRHAIATALLHDKRVKSPWILA